MKISMRLIGFALILASYGFATPAGTAENLQFSPRPGDKFNFKMSGRLDFLGTCGDITADILVAVTKVDNDRAFTMTSSQTNTEVVSGGSTVSLPDSFYTTVNKPNGELLELHGDKTDATAWRMMVLRRFIYPPSNVSVGDEWSCPFAADAKRGTVAAISTFKLVALERIGRRGTGKVRVVSQENEGTNRASSEGHVWIDTSDGSFVKSEISWRNAPTPQGPINGKITIARI